MGAAFTKFELQTTKPAAQSNPVISVWQSRLQRRQRQYPRTSSQFDAQTTAQQRLQELL